MDDFDLNIDNYNLEDILNLFHLTYEFKPEDMKKAKSMALKTHPDKSRLSKDVFLFFMKAYKMLKAIYEYRCKKEKCAKNNVYSAEVDTENKQLLQKLDGKSAKEFNKWFNDMFDNVKVKSEDVDSGYGDWFKSAEDMDKGKISSMSAMEDEFEKRKQQQKALIVHQGIRDIELGGGYNLTREKPEQYSSEIFSNLPYQDLKRAHTETVVPITREDYLMKPKFDNIESYVRHREENMPDMVSLEQSRTLLNRRASNNAKTNTERAFRLIKRDEEISKANKKWWSHLKQLKN
jgi:hypothetical protein